MASDAFYQAYVEIVPEAKNLRKTLAAEFDAAGPEAGKRAGEGVNSGVLGAVGKLAAPLAAAFASIGIGKIIGDSIGKASDFTEAATAITAVFGDADSTIQAFAANAASTLGQSKNEALDAARTFGVFGKAAGLTGQDLASFSTDFVGLAGDLASFNNTTPEQAIEALGAGLRGESEPLRQYGVLLDDAALKARATELGIYSGTGALTQQQKVLAAQAEIMAQTSTQQGDFARTSGGLANQQRILAAGLENLSTTFGAIFLPIATTVVGFLNTAVVPAFQGLAGMLTGGEMPAGVASFLGAFQPIIDFFGAVFRPIFEQLAPVFASIIPQLLTLWTSLSPLSILFTALQPVLPQLMAAFSQIAGVLGGALGQALTTIVPAVVQLSGILSGVLGQVLTLLVPIINRLVAILTGQFTKTITLIMPIVSQIATVLGEVLGSVLTALVPIITLVATTFGQILTALSPLFGILVPLIGAVLQLVAPLLQLVGAILQPLISLFTALLTPILGLIGPLVSLLVPVLSFIVTILTEVVKWVAVAITWFANLVTGSGDAGAQLATIWNQTLGMFGDFFANTFGMFVDFGSNTAGMISDFVSNTMGMFADFWSNTVGMFSDGIGNIVSFFVSLPGMIWNALGDLGSFLLKAGEDLIQGFIDGITGMIGNIGDAIGGVMDFIGGFFPHSPAERGPFSGSGWQAVKNAGLAIGDQLGAGLDAATPGLNGKLSSMVSVPALTSHVDSSVFASADTGSAGPKVVVLRVGEREFTGYMDERADSRVANDNSRRSTVQAIGRRPS